MTANQLTELSATVELLPQVYDLLLDQTQEISDDTWLQKLLSWFQTTFQDHEQPDQLLTATGVLSFLESASVSGQGSCLYFAVRVLPCVATAISSDKKKNMDARKQHVSDGKPCRIEIVDAEQAGDPTIRAASVQLLHTGRTLLERCRTYSADMSLAHAWILTAVELVGITQWQPVLDQLGVIAIAIGSLEHESMFIVNAAEIFLARVLLLANFDDGLSGADTGLAHTKPMGLEEHISRKRQTGKEHDAQIPTKVPRLDRESTEVLPRRELAVIQKWLPAATSITTKHLGICVALLKLSATEGLSCLMKMDVTPSVCIGLKTADPASITTTLVGSILETMAQISVLPDACLRFVTAVVEALAGITEEQVQWGTVCLLLPHLWPLHEKCSQGDVETRILQMFSSVLLTLSDDSLPGVPRQVQQSMKYRALLCLDKIATQGPDLWTEFTSSLLTAVTSHLQWISSHHGSWVHMNRNIKQTLDLVNNIIKAGGSDDEWTVVTSIMHRVLDLISMADCDNTILNKGFTILQSFFQFNSKQRDDGLMLTLTNILQKHLVSTHWGMRDSTLCFIGTIMDSQNELVTDWLIETGLYFCVWTGLDDEENYVRETALRSLSSLTRNKTIFSHFLMRQGDLTKITVVEKVLSVLSDDTGGFARRAAMKLLCEWFSDDIDLLSYTTDTSDHRTPRIAEVVLSTVVTAMRDFDWEVKLSALQFCEQFLASIVPGLIIPGNSPKYLDSSLVVAENLPDTDAIGDVSIPHYAVNLVAAGSASNDLVQPAQDGSNSRKYPSGSTRDVIRVPLAAKDHHGGSNTMYDDGWIGVLKDHMCLQLLCEKLNDEDGAVCQRSCEILINLRKHLVHISAPNRSGDTTVSSEVSAVINHIESYCIDDRELACYPERMAPLLEDIVMMANKGKRIDADCY